MASFQPETSISTGKAASTQGLPRPLWSRWAAASWPDLLKQVELKMPAEQASGLKETESRTVRAASSSDSLEWKEMSMSLAYTVA